MRLNRFHTCEQVAIGAGLQTFEVSTLGQPFENMKVMMAAHRNDTLLDACRRLYSVRGVFGFWQGLVPWAWIEALTKGGVLLFSQHEIKKVATGLGSGPELSNALGGVGGGICQAYSTMGVCCFMKTVEVTRSKAGPGGQKSTLTVAADILRRDGILGMYKGVNAVALRQATNWGSRFGFSRVIESMIGGKNKDRSLTKGERLTSSVLGGALACWNQPFEVVRVEMQRADSNPATRTIGGAIRHIYETSGVRGFYRGVTPRIGLSAYLTTVMVFGGDEVRSYLKKRA
ncbi:mitochondrial DNA replication protein YHM2 [Gracilaria domingensis]|nr:mitochondrial DNA replication protein YHM2 [Gracilaria domingensis]